MLLHAEARAPLELSVLLVLTSVLAVILCFLFDSGISLGCSLHDRISPCDLFVWFDLSKLILSERS